MGQKSLQIIENNQLLSENGIIVVEHHPDEDYKDSIGYLIKYKYKKYGNTALSFYHIEEESS